MEDGLKWIELRQWAVALVWVALATAGFAVVVAIFF